jgi:large subunit ribosomal protein L35
MGQIKRQIGVLALRLAPSAVAFGGTLCHNPALPAARLIKGCRGGGEVLISTRSLTIAGVRAGARALIYQESQMPKIKTKSGAKKRFKVTGTGKVLYAQSGKRHGMIKRTKKQIRQLRGTNVLFKTDGDNIKKYFLPNG